MVHRLFSEAHTIYDTVRKVWVLYDPDKTPIPAIVGYVNLYINREYYGKYSKVYKLDDFLIDIFKITISLGVGTSRATEFGHTILKAVRKDESTNRDS